MITNADRIKEAADVLGIVQRRVPLRQKGNQWKGLCPFHQEKTPSFTVTPAKQMFHCFGCGRGGDAVKFVMDFENKTYPEALEIIAAESGVIVVNDRNQTNSDEGILRQDLYKACLLAADHYHQRLLENKKALEYLQSRGFDSALIGKFNLGYAMAANIADCGADADVLLEAGILGKPEETSLNQKLYDPLAGRVIIPLSDSLGRVVAFTGRKIHNPADLSDDLSSTPKYKNTRETKIFKKSEILYGYKFAQEMLRTSQKGVKRDLYVLEGQLKTIAALNAGFAAVAPGGTAFTARQAVLIDALNPDTVYLVPDADAAGIQSAIRTAAELRKLEINVKIACLTIPEQAELPPGKVDPDDLMAKGLPVTWEHYNLVEWLLLVMCQKPYNSPDAARQITDNILPVILSHANPIVRETELNLLSSLSGISQINLSQYRPAETPVPVAPAGDVPPPPAMDTAMTPGRYLCASLLQIPLEDTNSEVTGRLWYSNWLDWLELPIPVIKTIRKIAAIHKHMNYYKVPAATAIQTLVKDEAERSQFNYWLSLEDIEKADIELFARLQPEIIEHHRKNLKIGGAQ